MAKRILKVTMPTPATSGTTRGADFMLKDLTTGVVETVHVEVLNEDFNDPAAWTTALCAVDGDVEICTP